MPRTTYAAVFAVVAAVTSIPPAYVIAHYHGVLPLALIRVLCPSAAIFAGLFAFLFGRNRSGLRTVLRGIGAMLAGFICTIAVDLLLVDSRVSPLSGPQLAELAGGFLFFSVFGLLGHGWYVVLIGAVTPLVVRAIVSRYVA